MPDAEDVLKITCFSPDNEAEQHCLLQSGESVCLGKEPQPEGAGITLSGATSRVSRMAARIIFKDGRVVVEKIISASAGVVTEEFSCFVPGESRKTIGAGQYHIFDKPGRFEIPDAEGTHVVHLDFDTPVYPVRGSPRTAPNVTAHNNNVKVWEELCTQSDDRKRACLALVAAWFIQDFEFIPAETIPTSKQLAHLSGKSQPAVNNLLYRTRRFLDPRQADVDDGVISQKHCDRGQLVGRQFRDEDLMVNVKWGNQVLAQWVMEVSRAADPHPITLADILKLDGLVGPDRPVELERRGN